MLRKMTGHDKLITIHTVGVWVWYDQKERSELSLDYELLFNCELRDTTLSILNGPGVIEPHVPTPRKGEGKKSK